MRKIFIGIFCIASHFCWAQDLVFNGWKYSAPSYTYDTVQVNIHASGLGSIADAGWNNWVIATNADGANFSSTFNWTTGSSSGIQAAWRLSNKTSRALVGYADNTAGYASAQTTNFPTGVFRSVGYNNNFGDTFLMFTGLDNTKTYRIEAVGSRNTATSYVNGWIYGAASQSYAPNNNISNVVVLDNMAPVSGTIDISVVYTTGVFSFINAFRLIQITTE